MRARQRPQVTLAKLKNAAAAGHLFMMYQPKLDLRANAITGVEALARWQHPRQGAISPSIFVPAAEKSGAIDWFTEWALTAAACQWSAWRAEGLSLELAVNISPLNLEHACFPDRVSRICADKGVPQERLMLELTEGATQEAKRLLDAVARFRLKGIGISLDDFGTGYGSLVHLRRLPFTELKIDRAFVSDLLVSRDSRAITRGLIGMAHEIGLTVTAEGVEDYATLETLQALGCDKAQGYLIARAMPGDRFPLWMRGWVAPSAQADPARAVDEPPVSRCVARRGEAGGREEGLSGGEASQHARSQPPSAGAIAAGRC